MERSTLRSGEDVKAFIKAQDEARQQACAVFIASRAALRASPVAILFFEFDEATIKRDVTSLFTWRPTLIATVAATMPSDEIRNAAFYAPDFAVYDAAATRVAATGKTAVIAVDAVAATFNAAARVAIAAPAATFDAAVARAAGFAARAAEIWAEVSRDASLWLEHADQRDGTLAITVAPLWSNENPLEHDWHNLREKLLAADTPDERGADWSFWIKWYDDILAGNPQNWDMLHEIATTDAIDWNSSAREVNDTINQIVERYRLRDEVVALRREVEQLGNATQYPPRNHYNPPEMVTDAREVQEQLSIIWAAVREAEEELEKPKPDPSILSKAGQIILDFGIWFAKYCGKKLDLVINTNHHYRDQVGHTRGGCRLSN